MGLPSDRVLRFRTLHDSSLVRVREFDCRACRGGPSGEEGTHANEIVFLRHGAFCRHFGRRSVTTDTNRVAFFARGSSWRTSHPGDCGDRGLVLELAPSALDELRREFEPEVEDERDAPLPFDDGLCTPALAWRQRMFARSLCGAPDELRAQSEALELAREALRLAYAAVGRSSEARRRPSDEHRELAEAAQVLLSRRLDEPLGLEALARALGASPFHLARVFKAVKGVSLHRYRTRLRLHAALERIEAGATDLSELALELGFASHSHFTDAFRREFGRPPSAARTRPRSA